MNISAIIITRGNVDLGPVLSTIEADEIVIRKGHGGCWERWEAAMRARHEVVYVQDDDAVVPYADVVAAYDPNFMTCNMPMDRRPEYQDGIALVGWGCVFHQAQPHRAMEKYGRFFDSYEWDPLFTRECDRVVTGLSPLKLIDVGFQHLPHAHGLDRMGKQLEHGESMRQIRQRIYQVRQQAA